MRPITLLLALFPAVASAALCDRIEYAEVKDWPADKIEDQYCHAMLLNQNRMDLWQGLQARGVLSRAKSDEITADSQSCLDQAALMRRVLVNLYQREPVCGRLPPPKK